MSFFKKLKSKLFKSSSKLEEGLDAIVEDGGVEDELGGPQVDPEAERAREAEEIAQQKQAREVKAERLAEQAHQAEAARVAQEQAAAQRARAEEEARQKHEQALASARAEEAAAAAARLADQAETAKARAQAEAAAKAAQEAARADAERTEAARLAEIEAARIEAARIKAEEDAQIDEAVREQARKAAEAEQPAQTPEATKKPGLFGRLLGRGETKTVLRRELDDDMLEALEELLIASDMGVDTALRVTANMAEGRFGKKLSTQEIKELLAAEIAKIMEPVAKPMPLYPKRPQVVLVVGVNGSGKTTTIGKLALQFSNAGKKVVIAAGDTFRAAAVEQLQVWGDRAGVPVLTAPEGSDPASLAFDAMTKAEADGADLLMIDTAGRLQNRADLMEELAKIVRVIRKKDETAPHNTLLVLDATTGQNALNQVDVFQQISDVSGLVMTKLDGTAKGGVLVALADKFGLPIHAIGVGEQIDDLAPFDPDEFAQALTGAATE